MKRIIERIVSCLLLLVLLLMNFVACLDEADIQASEETTLDSFNNSVDETFDGVCLVSKMVSEYKIIVASNADAATKVAATKLQDGIKEKVGVTIPAGNDLIVENLGMVERECEILIGRSNREASKVDSDKLLYYDYEMFITGKKLVISGGSGEAIESAVDCLLDKISELAERDPATIIITDEMCFSYQKEYPCQELTLNAQKISDYQIVYPDGNSYLMGATQRLQKSIAELCGHCPSLVSEKKAEKNRLSIFVGDIGSEYGFLNSPIESEKLAIEVSAGGHVRLRGNEQVDTLEGIRSLIDLMSEENASTDLSVLDTTYLPITVRTYSVMSFNLLCDHQWEERKGLALDAILSQMPDSIGLQEDHVGWKTYLESELETYGYKRVGGNFSLGDDEIWGNWSNSIFYRADKFDLIKTETLTYVQAARRVGIRITSTVPTARAITYVILRDKTNGRQFVHLNTHFGFGVGEFVPQIKILQALTDQITESHKISFVSTGDYNIVANENEYNMLAHNADWVDGGVSFNKPTTCDFIYNSRYSVIPLDYQVLNCDYGYPWVTTAQWGAGQKNGQSIFLSDHKPLVLVVYII